MSIQAYNAITNRPLMPYYVLDTNAKFELPSEDIPTAAEFTISNIFMGDEGIDNDKDGYYSSRDLNFTVSVDQGNYDLTGQILQKKVAGDDNYTVCKNIPEFAVSPAGTTQKVIVDGLPGPLHDLKIELFHGTTLVAEALPVDDPD